MGQLSKLTLDVRQAILHVRWRLSVFNEEVDQMREWFRLTYDGSLSESNRLSMLQNLEQSYRQIEEQARMLANLIAEVRPRFRCLD